MFAAKCIGTFERNLGDLFLYRNYKGRDNFTYLLRKVQTGEVVCILPKDFPVWQNQGQFKIWLLVKGLL
jgi:hypothetical protein